jgi:hypothetical protein
VLSANTRIGALTVGSVLFENTAPWPVKTSELAVVEPVVSSA